MMYKIINTGRAVKTYYTEQGRRIKVEPGETVRRKSRPPKNESGWRIEEIEEETKQSEDSTEGGDN